MNEAWMYLGLQDIRLRYRRSVLGPWWVTISTAIMVLALGFLWSRIFITDIKHYMPFFAIGFVAWTWISTQVLESATGFRQFDGIIRQIKIPFPVYVLRLCVRNCIILMHNFLVVILVLAFVGSGLHVQSLLFIPAFILIQVNLTLIGIMVAIFCTRFPDMTQVVASLVQLMFFFSPILWQPSEIKGESHLITANPLYHWLEILREPLLGRLPTVDNWLYALSTALVLAIVSPYMMGRFKSRIAYWL